MIWNISRPDGVLRSRLSLRLANVIPSASNCARALTRCFNERPNRSSFQSKPKTAISHWQCELKRLFELAKVANGHAHRFRDTFATGLLLQGVSLEQVSVLFAHSSIRITERHYAPWVRSRQEQLEADVRSTWKALANETKGTSEVHDTGGLPN